jgi:hypothetical protein
MSTHALLSPSSAHRWLTCTPSARAEEHYPDTSSEAAKEGTVAHKLAELRLTMELGIWHHDEQQERGMQWLQEDLDKVRMDKLYTTAMEEHIDEYVSFVQERVNDAKDPVIFLEHTLDLTEYIPEGFGTGDVIILDHGVLELIDLKYGKGVKVNAENNKQLKTYGLGALRTFGFLFDFDRVRLTIYQPRIGNFSTWEIETKALTTWATDELIPKAKLAWEGKGEYVAGDHCRFCKAAATCKALASKNMELAKYEFEDANKLTPAEISDILTRADDFKTWIKAVEEYALDQAVNHGAKFPGFKVVEGRSTRKYSDEILVAKKLQATGLDVDDIYDMSVKGITAMEKILGKKRFADVLSDLIVKPPGKPTLVDLEDKRPELNSTAAAITDFE